MAVVIRGERRGYGNRCGSHGGCGREFCGSRGLVSDSATWARAITHFTAGSFSTRWGVFLATTAAGGFHSGSVGLSRLIRHLSIAVQSSLPVDSTVFAVCAAGCDLSGSWQSSEFSMARGNGTCVFDGSMGVIEYRCYAGPQSGVSEFSTPVGNHVSGQCEWLGGWAVDGRDYQSDQCISYALGGPAFSRRDEAGRFSGIAGDGGGLWELGVLVPIASVNAFVVDFAASFADSVSLSADLCPANIDSHFGVCGERGPEWPGFRQSGRCVAFLDDGNHADRQQCVCVVC